MVCAVEVLVEFVAELGGDHPMVTVTLDRFADQTFGQVITVTLGGVDEVDSQFLGAFQYAVDLLLREGLAPFSAKLPGTNAHGGHLQLCSAQAAILHRSFSFQTKPIESNQRIDVTERTRRLDPGKGCKNLELEAGIANTAPNHYPTWVNQLPGVIQGCRPTQATELLCGRIILHNADDVAFRVFIQGMVAYARDGDLGHQNLPASSDDALNQVVY